MSGTPAALLPGTPTAGDVLVDTILPAGALPDAPEYHFFLETVTVDAGKSATVDKALAGRFPGPLIDIVLDGAYQARPGGPAQVFRDGATQPREVPAGATVALTPGDAIVRQNEDGWTVTNAGTTPLRLLHVSLIPNGPEPPPLSWNFGDYAFVAPMPRPPLGAIEVQVRRAILAPHQTLPPPAPGIARASIHLDSRQAVLQSSDGSLQNPGIEPITLYVMTARALPSAATPSASAAAASPAVAAPTGVTDDMVVFDQRLDEIPSGATWTGVERYTFAPGETWPQGMSPGAGYGPMLYRLESGAMTVRAAGSFTLTRAATGAASQVPKDTDVVLAPSDVVFMPFGVTSTWRNTGATPARLLDAGIAFTSDVSPKDVDADFNFDAYPIQPPRTPADFTLRRLTLASGGAIAVAPASGVQLLGVESGGLTLVQAGAAGAASLETRQVSVPPMNGNPNLTDLNDRMQPTIQALRNDSAASATFFLLTITPLGTATPLAP